MKGNRLLDQGTLLHCFMCILSIFMTHILIYSSAYALHGDSEEGRLNGHVFLIPKQLIRIHQPEMADNEPESSLANPDERDQPDLTLPPDYQRYVQQQQQQQQPKLIANDFVGPTQFGQPTIDNKDDRLWLKPLQSVGVKSKRIAFIPSPHWIRSKWEKPMATLADSVTDQADDVRLLHQQQPAVDDDDRSSHIYVVRRSSNHHILIGNVNHIPDMDTTISSSLVAKRVAYIPAPTWIKHRKQAQGGGDHETATKPHQESNRDNNDDDVASSLSKHERAIEDLSRKFSPKFLTVKGLKTFVTIHSRSMNRKRSAGIAPVYKPTPFGTIF